MAQGKRADESAMMAMLAEYTPPSKVAKALDIDMRTVYAKMADPMFKAQLTELRGAALGPTALNAVRVVDGVVEVMRQIVVDGKLRNDKKPIHVSIRAMLAPKLIDCLFKIRHEALVAPRMAAIEAALAAHGIDLPLAVPAEKSGE
jgi:hypothetical protein